MKFTKSNIKPVEHDALEAGDIALASFSTFRQRSGYWIGTFIADDESAEAIIGSTEEYRIGDLLPLKGNEVKLSYVGTKVVNENTYPRFVVGW